jgi:DNA repair exonuclease SbcCD nuclease subunit
MFKEIFTTNDKFLIIGDVHFGNKNNDLDILDLQKKFFESIKEYVINNSIKEIIFVGDIFHNRTYLKINVINDAIQILSDLADFCNIYILCGNHDVYSKINNTINSLIVFKYIKNITIIDTEPLILKTPYYSFLFVPFFSIKEDEKLFYDKIKNKEYDIYFEKYNGINNIILITHTSIMQHPELFEERFSVDLDALKRFFKVFNGDIHIRSEFNNIYNIGSIMSFDFNDVFNKKGVYEICLNPFKTKFIENKFDKEYKSYKLTYLEKLTKEEIISKLNNSIVRIEIDLSDKENKFLETLKEILKETQNTQIFYYYYNSQDDDSKNIEIKNKNGSYSGNNIENVVFEYIEQKVKDEHKKKKIKSITEEFFQKIKKEN